MATLLITYDLNRETSRPKITDKIKKTYTTWAKLSESSYAVSTTSTPQKVYETLSPLIDGNDNLYVITLNRPYCGQGPKDVNDWLEKNLPY